MEKKPPTTLPAVAIEAAVFGAGAANEFELLAQVLAGAEEADVDGIDAYSGGGGEVGGGFAAKIHAAKEFGLGCRKVRDNSHHTLAELTLVFGAHYFRPLLLESGEGPVAGGPAAVSVNDGMAKNPVKPLHRSFVILRLGFRANGFEETLLDDVSGEFGITGAGTHEVHEGIEILDQRGGVHLPGDYKDCARKTRKCVTRRGLVRVPWCKVTVIFDFSLYRPP